MEDNAGLFIPNIPPQINSRYIIKKELGKVPMAPFILLSIGLLEKSTRRYRISLHRVALKRINDVFRTKTDAKRTLREITILRQCHHPNIAALK